MMLQNIHDRMQGWILATIIGVLCLSFALWGIQYYLQRGKHGDVVAKVNGAKIYSRQLQSSLRRATQQLRYQLGDSYIPTQARQAALKKQVLATLINEIMLSQDASEQGVRVTPPMLRSFVINSPVFQMKGRFSPALFERYVSSFYGSEASFYGQLQRQLLITQIQSGVVNTSFALPAEVADAKQLVDETRDFSYVVIPTARFMQKFTPKSEAIQAYYQQHQDAFRTLARVKIDYIELSGEQLKRQTKVTDKQLQAYYQNNIAQFSTPKRWKVAQILIRVPENATQAVKQAAKARLDSLAKQLQQGATFANLAKRHSEDEGSAKQGGVLPWFTRKQRPPLFTEVLSHLKPGQLSQPFESKAGYHLLRLIAVQEPSPKPFAKVKARVKNLFIHQQVESRYADLYDQLSELTFTNPDSLEPAAKALGLAIKTTPYFGRQGTKTGITSRPQVIKAAFSEQVRQQGNNSAIISINNTAVVVLRVNAYQPSQLQPLSAVKETIIQRLRAQRADQDAKALSVTLANAINQGASPAVLAKDKGVRWQVKSKISREQKGINALILKAAFSLPVEQGRHGNRATFLSLPEKGYAVVAVARVHPGKASGARLTPQSPLASRLIGGYGGLDYFLYVQDVKKHSKIKTFS